MCDVALSFIQHPLDASMIAGYILVIPHQACFAGCRYDHTINKSNSAGDMSAGDMSKGDIRVQEYQMSGSNIIIMSSPRKSDNNE